MAYALEVTIGTGNKVSLNYQSQEVNVSITYRLEREDGDVLELVREKADELVAVHALSWKRIKEGERPPAAQEETKQDTDAVEADTEDDLSAQYDQATATQCQLIRSLSQQAGDTSEELSRRIQDAGGVEVVEDLSHTQAASLLVELGREERTRFERERTRSPQEDDKPYSNSP